MKLSSATSPILRLAFGLVGLAGCLLIAVDLIFGFMPEHSIDSAPALRTITEMGARQLVEGLQTSNREAMEQKLAKLRADYPPLVGIVVRDKEGSLVISSGMRPPTATAGPNASPKFMNIPIAISSQHATWGTAEFIFQRPGPHTLSDWARDRRIWLPLGTAIGMVLLAYFYLRRAMNYLDPSSVVPDRLRAAFDGLTEGVVLLDANGRVVLANIAFRKMSGADASRIHGKKLLEAARFQLPHPDDTPPWEKVVATGVQSVGLYVQIGPEDQARSGHLNCSPIADGRGKVRGCLVTIADMTAVEKANQQLTLTLSELQESRKKIEAQNKELENLANLDGLSGLLNRRRFFELARAALARGANKERNLAVFMLDIDHFKSFNDRYGHATGDAVIQAVAKCLRNTLRGQDLAGRYGGEEFCVLCEDIEEAAAKLLAERVRMQIEMDAGRGVFDGQDLKVTISIGVASNRSTGTEDLPELLGFADSALYTAKKEGRNRVVLARKAVPASNPELAAQ